MLRFDTTAHAALLLALSPPAVTAQSPPKVFYACYVPLIGAVYRIKEPGVSDKCFGPTTGPYVHIEFSWTDGLSGLHSGDVTGGDLAGTFPNPSVAKLQGTAVSTTAPASGQVLTFNGTTWAPAAAAAAGGTTANTPNTLVQRDANGGFAAGALTLAGKIDQTSTAGLVARGTLNSGSIPATGPGVRFMWYPGKAAIRAGYSTGTEWDDANIGGVSVAFGQDARASGIGSFAQGYNTQATGQSAVAMGSEAQAGGFAAISLGNNSNASAEDAVALGDYSAASGSKSIAIGDGALASGENAIAIGSVAQATKLRSIALGGGTSAHAGAFVFGDGSNPFANVSTSANNQFVVRAVGGTIFYSDGSLTSGVSLAPGAGAWSSVSDVNRKQNFQTVDGESVLDKIASMPIQEWNYKTQSASIRHLGPTAQDFRAAFGLGESDTTITTTDIDGINLLAVQALERRTAELKQASSRIDALCTDIAALEKRLAAVEAALHKENAP